MFRILLILICITTSSTLFAQSSGAKAPTWGDHYVEEAVTNQLSVCPEVEVIDLSQPSISEDVPITDITPKMQASRRRQSFVKDNSKLKKAIRVFKKPEKKSLEPKKILRYAVYSFIIYFIFGMIGILLFASEFGGSISIITYVLLTISAIFLFLAIGLFLWWVVEKLKRGKKKEPSIKPKSDESLDK